MYKRSWSQILVLAMLFISTHTMAAGQATDLTAVFETYCANAKAGDVDAMLSLRTTSAREAIREQIRDKKDRDYFLLIGRAQAPESYEVQHVAWSGDGNRAELYAVLQLPAMKQIDRPRTRMEMRMTFARENNAWKLGDLLPLGNPDEIKRPTDLSYRESDAKRDVTAAEVAGRVVSIDFRSDHTLIMLRVMNEEVAVFLPRKAILDKAGVDFNQLAPWKRRVFTGYPHSGDKLRFFATGDHPMEGSISR